METRLSKLRQRCLRNITINWNPGSSDLYDYLKLKNQEQSLRRYAEEI